MEKLHTGLILILFSLSVLNAQRTDRLCVFLSNGTILNEETGQQLHKGDFIKRGDTLKFTTNSFLTAIDQEGSAYQNNLVGNYTFNDLIKKKKKLFGNLTSKYLQFLYEELTDSQQTQTVIAGVYRGNNLIISPPDSALVSKRSLKFVWKNDFSSPLFYFFLKNSSNNEVLKIGVKGSELKLYSEMSIFESSEQFEWTVDTREYPDLENIGWNQFKIVDSNLIKTEIKTFESTIEDFEALGLSKLEINEILCHEFRLCE